jgi:CDP-diglyceride synthetase|tara:strand:+ start:4052 stop:4192 length:141 start_codon:yes stop_codon:yes gene_type:complete
MDILASLVAIWATWEMVRAVANKKIILLLFWGFILQAMLIIAMGVK